MPSAPNPGYIEVVSTDMNTIKYKFSTKYLFDVFHYCYIQKHHLQILSKAKVTALHIGNSLEPMAFLSHFPNLQGGSEFRFRSYILRT